MRCSLDTSRDSVTGTRGACQLAWQNGVSNPRPCTQSDWISQLVFIRMFVPVSILVTNVESRRGHASHIASTATTSRAAIQAAPTTQPDNVSLRSQRRPGLESCDKESKVVSNRDSVGGEQGAQTPTYSSLPSRSQLFTCLDKFARSEEKQDNAICLCGLITGTAGRSRQRTILRTGTTGRAWNA